MFDLEEIYRWTTGDPLVSIAVLDGPVDVEHESLKNANIRTGLNVPAMLADQSAACQHGTLIASIIFGQLGSSVSGIAPGCSGILLPIYSTTGNNNPASSTQLDLARMITQALAEGARVINISGGEFSVAGQASPLLSDAIRQCRESDVLIVAAAGNQGCDCLNVPASVDSVLAVGATDWAGEPLPLNNFGHAYQIQGIVAPGKEILGAKPGGGTYAVTGTSAACAWVSGVVGLLISFQIRIGQKPSPLRVRRALLESAVDCSALPAQDCKRLFVGRINIPRAIANLLKDQQMNNHEDVNAAFLPETPSISSVPETVIPSMPTSNGVTPSASVQPQACGCGGGKQIVYVLGEIGYDMISEARRDSFAQKMAAEKGIDPNSSLPLNPAEMIQHLKAHTYEAESIEWTLLLDGTPIYAIRPAGPFAKEAYDRLREFLNDQIKDEAERISVPGTLAGTAKLFSGQVVPVIVPDIRGMFNWKTSKLVASGENGGASGKKANDFKKEVERFLERIYFGLRNLGVLPQHRAINFAATNAFKFEKIMTENFNDEKLRDLDFESINVVPSPFGRPGSDCWDVEVYFFNPQQQVLASRYVYRFTVDVSDIMPVTIGPMHQWWTR